MTIREVVFSSSDNHSRIRGFVYQPDEPAAIIQIVHDAVEHISLYKGLINYLVDEGYAVCAHDQIGHGQSVSDEMFLGSFDEGGYKDLMADLYKMHMIAKKEVGDLPCFLLGQGMGAALCRLLAVNSGGISGLILSGEQKRRRILKAVNVMNLAWHGRDGRVPEGIMRLRDAKKCAAMTADPVIQESLSNDRLCSFNLTISASRELQQICEFANRQATLNGLANIPVFLMAGGEDWRGKNGEAASRLFRRLSRSNPGLTLRIFPQGRQQLYLDSCRGEVFQEVTQWLGQCLETG